MNLSPILLATFLLLGISLTSASPWDTIRSPFNSFRSYVRKLYGWDKGSSTSASSSKPVYTTSEALIPGSYPMLYGQDYSQFAQQAQQSNQQPGYFYPTGSEQAGSSFAYGTYRGIGQQQQQGQQGQQGQQQAAPDQSPGPQPQYAFPPQYNQLQQYQFYNPQAYRPVTNYYRPAYSQGAQQGPQADESTNQAEFQSPSEEQQQPALASSQGVSSQMSAVADQDGISYVRQPVYSQQPISSQYLTSGYQTSGASAVDQMAASASNIQPQTAASYYRPAYYRPQTFAAKPYGQAPGTIDVHQVMDQFLRSNGLNPQGDHDNTPGDYAYAESGLKPVFSYKKLLSYPFFASSSGDKPTSYGQSIRRQSIDDSPRIAFAPKPEALVAPQPLRPIVKYSQKTKPQPEVAQPAPTTTSASSATSDSDESQFIAKQAQVLQDFLAAGSGKKTASANHYFSSQQQPVYQPPVVDTSGSDTPKDTSIKQ